jgi:thiol-disulfide isomerase/thioredoxin
MKRTITIILAILMASILLLSCSKDDSSARNNPAPAAKSEVKTSPAETVPARTAPAQESQKSEAAFANVTVVDVDGNRRAMSEWVGKQPVVVNFWGTWCPPCRREIPGLVKLYDEYRNKGVEIVSLAIERTASPQQVKEFGQKAGMGWVMAMSNDVAYQAFHLTGSVPTTIFYDASGKEVSRHVGARSYEDFKSEFRKIAVK